MAKSRSIVILTAPRSGSSALAGALHSMGVNMGEGFFQPTDGLNPKGYYESMLWRRPTNQLTGVRYDVRIPNQLPEPYRKRYLSAIARSKAGGPVWGVKDTRMVFVFPLILSMIQAASDLRVISLKRQREGVISSLVDHSRRAYGGRFKLSYNQASKKVAKWTSAQKRCLELLDKEILLEVSYEEMLTNTLSVMDSLRDFCFDGFKKHASTAKKAARFIDPDLNHQTISPEKLLPTEENIEEAKQKYAGVLEEESHEIGDDDSS